MFGCRDADMTEELATPEIAARRLDFSSRSSADTIRIGHEIAGLLTPPKLLILRGTLGAGKTTLVKGIAEALNAAEADEVTSPTFTLVHEYEGPASSLGRRRQSCFITWTSTGWRTSGRWKLWA